MSAMRSLILLMAAVLVCKCIASKASQLVSVQRDDVDGERLIKLGQSFNNSMLKLVGMHLKTWKKLLYTSFVRKTHARCGHTGQTALLTELKHSDIKHDCANVGTTVLMHVPKMELLP